MRRSPVWGQKWWVMGVGGCVGLGACALKTDLPHRSEGATPVSSGVMLSGVTAPDADAALGTGDDTLLTDIKDGFGGAASAAVGGIDSGGAPDESAGGIGGAVSNGGGTAGAGGNGGNKSSAHGGASSMGGAAGAGHSGASATSAAGGASNPKASLYFSEYVEGSSAYKALEITTQSRSVLDDCKVGTYFNGKTEATVVSTLSGVLEAGQVLTLCSSALQEKLGAPCKQVGNLTFNGDDVVALSCAGKILDVIGQVGIDPGTGWGSATNSTLDHTLRRKCTVTSGDVTETNAFDPSGEWLAFPVDTFDGLGARGC